MKKVLCLLLSLLMLVGVMATASAETYQFITRYAETDNITYVLNELTKEYQKEHPDFALELNIVPETDQIILVNAASNDLPEIMLFAFVDTPKTLAEQGMMADLQEVFEKAGVADCLPEGFFEEFAATCGTDKCYQLPTSYNVEGFWYHKDMFEDNGLEVPTTIEEFEAVCEALLEKGIQPCSLAGMDYPPTRWYQNLVQRLGGSEFADSIDACEESYQHELSIKAMEKLVEWNERGFFGPGIATVDKNTMLNVFMERRAAMTYYSTNGTSIFQNGNIQGEIGFFPFPSWESAGGVGARTEMITTYGWTWGLSAEAVTDELIDWLSFVMPRFGDTALLGVQLVTPYTISDEAKADTGFYANLALSAIGMRTGGFHHSGAKMSSPLIQEFRSNMSLLLIGEMTPQEVGAAMDEAILMAE